MCSKQQNELPNVNIPNQDKSTTNPIENNSPSSQQQNTNNQLNVKNEKSQMPDFETKNNYNLQSLSQNQHTQQYLQHPHHHNMNTQNTQYDHYPGQQHNHPNQIQKGGLMDKKRSAVNYVKSRDELLEFESEYYENLRQKVIIKRRTKIIATLNSNNYKTYEEVRSLFLAGVSSFLINMAYCEPSFLVSLNQWRNQLEAEFQVYIPLTCVLKGSLVRIGMLSQPETYLKKGQEYRILIQKKIVGDSNICSVDDDHLVKRLGIGAKLIIDYGQVGLTVIGKEKSDVTLKYLQDNHNYGRYFTKLRSEKKKLTDSYTSSCCCSSSDLEPNAMSEQLLQSVSELQAEQLAAIQRLDKKQLSRSKEEDNTSESVGVKNVFAEELASKKLSRPQRLYDVIVCRVDSDCMLKSYKPIFIYKNRDEREALFYSKKSKQNGKQQQQQEEQQPLPQDSPMNQQDNQMEEDECEEEEYDQVGENVLHAKDITDIANALSHDFDSICVSNVRTAQDILAVRKYCETSKSTRIIAKIQTLEGVQNFQEILSVSDSVLIARGYLTVQIPVEKLHFKQNELIALANESLKPVLVSCNILDSMVSSLLPTTCEVGEISNLVTQQVDSIILSGETSYGMHPKQAVETLSRICMETEALQIQHRNPSDSSLSVKQRWMQKQSVSNAIVQCTLNAAYNITANLIIVFTSTGNTALAISKLRPPCPIIAVTADTKLARHLNYLSATGGIVFPSLVGTDILLEKVLACARQHKYIKTGDFVVVTSGQIENLSGTTNNMKIIQVTNNEVIE